MKKIKLEVWYAIYVKSLASILFHKILLLGMRAGGHFTALSLRINRCNEPLSYVFFVKRQSSVAVFFHM